MGVETGSCLKTLKGHTAGVMSVVLSKDGTKIVSGSRDGSIKIWDVETGSCLQTLEGHSAVYSVVLSKDETKIVSGSWDNTIKIWDVETGDCLQTLEGHTGWVISVVLSKDETKVVSGSNDNTIKIWNVGGLYVLDVLSLKQLLTIIVAQKQSISNYSHLMEIYDSLPSEIKDLISPTVEIEEKSGASDKDEIDEHSVDVHTGVWGQIFSILKDGL